jgi:hypothetical protein
MESNIKDCHERNWHIQRLVVLEPHKIALFPIALNDLCGLGNFRNADDRSLVNQVNDEIIFTKIAHRSVYIHPIAGCHRRNQTFAKRQWTAPVSLVPKIGLFEPNVSVDEYSTPDLAAVVP